MNSTDFTAYVGMDVHKDQIAIAVADSARGSEVRYWGQISSTVASVRKLVRKLKGAHGNIVSDA